MSNPNYSTPKTLKNNSRRRQLNGEVKDKRSNGRVQKVKLARDDICSKAYNLIQSNRAAALATSCQYSIPHVAMVYAVISPDFSIYFSTRVEGRKYINMIINPNVAMTFFNEKQLQTVQLSGKSERVEDLLLEQQTLHELMKLRYHDPLWPLPPLQLFERGATNEIAIMKVTPHEMTYADFKQDRSNKSLPFFLKVI